MATYSPADNIINQPGSSGYVSGGSSSARSPLSVSLGFLKGLTDRKTTRDGQAPKRRGPKPDSKPALTRRQELNRQAQRTHRERKEVYIKALEEQVMQLKETYTGAVQERIAVANENQKLRDLLRTHGIAYNGLENSTAAGFPTSYGGSLTESRSGSFGYKSRYSPGPNFKSGEEESLSTHNLRTGSDPYNGHASYINQQQLQGGIDHDQLGVDFVLALERPCMDHLQMMCVRSDREAEPSPNGHALMVSCPPYSHIDRTPDEPYPHKFPDLPNVDLVRLFQLSSSLALDGEITPVMALFMIRTHERYPELTGEDFEVLKSDLQTKTRCYGFGAVLEEFEVRDALTSVFTAT